MNVNVFSKPGFAFWLDPTDGGYIPVEGSLVSTKGERKFLPPTKNGAGESDWVLVIATRQVKDLETVH